MNHNDIDYSKNPHLDKISLQVIVYVIDHIKHFSSSVKMPIFHILHKNTIISAVTVPLSLYIYIYIYIYIYRYIYIRFTDEASIRVRAIYILKNNQI